MDQLIAWPVARQQALLISSVHLCVCCAPVKHTIQMMGPLYGKSCLQAESTAPLPSRALLGDIASLQTPRVANSFQGNCS